MAALQGRREEKAAALKGGSTKGGAYRPFATLLIALIYGGAIRNRSKSFSYSGLRISNRR